VYISIETASGQSIGEILFSDMNQFDVFLSSYDLNGTAKRFVPAEYFHLTYFKEFQCCIIDVDLEKSDHLLFNLLAAVKVCVTNIWLLYKAINTCNYIHY